MVTWGLSPANDRKTDSTADMDSQFIPEAVETSAALSS